MRILISFTLITFLISCHSKDDSAKYIQKLNTSDTFLFDLPRRETRLDTYNYIQKRKFENELKLEFLEKGFDSIQIRINYGCVMDKKWIVILSNKNKKWTAEISELQERKNPDFDEQNNTDDSEGYSYIRSSEFRTPKSGWKKFINKLFSYNILTLPEYKKLPNIDKNYPPVADGCGASVEVATKNAYRYYRYSNPDDYDNIYIEASNIISILMLLNKEFGIYDKHPWPSANSDEEESTERDYKIPKPQEIFLEDISIDTSKKNKN